MIMRIDAQRCHGSFEYYNFYDILEPGIFERCLLQSKRFPFFKVEQTRTSNPNRIWLNQVPGMLSAVAMEFDTDEVKRSLGAHMNTTFLGCRTRAELCMDTVGSWLEPHQDDPAKVLTLQLYLDGHGVSTNLGGLIHSVVPNKAWAFDNTSQPLHSLSPLEYNRSSIIINYVTDEWRDQSVLM